MLRRVSVACPVPVALAASPLLVCAAAPTAQAREMRVRHRNFFRNEAMAHARRVSWAPQTTPKKQGAFVRLSRSNFYDPVDATFSEEPFCEEEVEAHRQGSPDTYVYRYTVSPTHVSLRP